MQENNMIGDISIKEDILEYITSFIINFIELGLVSSSCECVKDFLDPFVDACA